MYIICHIYILIYICYYSYWFLFVRVFVAILKLKALKPCRWAAEEIIYYILCIYNYLWYMYIIFYRLYILFLLLLLCIFVYFVYRFVLKQLFEALIWSSHLKNLHADMCNLKLSAELLEINSGVSSCPASLQTQVEACFCSCCYTVWTHMCV